MNLYTYIMEFRGGTYVAQVKADNLNYSLEEWINQLTSQIDEIEHFGPKTIQELREQYLEENPEEVPVPLQGLINCWYTCMLTRQGFLSIHIIRTEKKV